ncbi:hypothetical protein [Gemmobacter sp.]|uniref:hypothetical protein n=1 Tax=Gemmobacter sp. TaxID=1898957 RepID=UPI002AFE49D5|nr:hypothetical protein [Gemmobacter sp.]
MHEPIIRCQLPVIERVALLIKSYIDWSPTDFGACPVVANEEQLSSERAEFLRRANRTRPRSSRDTSPILLRGLTARRQRHPGKRPARRFPRTMTPKTNGMAL